MHNSDNIINRFSDSEKKLKEQPTLKITSVEKAKESPKNEMTENIPNKIESVDNVNKSNDNESKANQANLDKIPKVEEKTEGTANIQKEIDTDNQSAEEENSPKNQYPDSSAVFKVDAYKIKGELSFLDKARILELAAKIPPSDYYKLKNYLTNYDPVEGIINTFSLLKLRLNNQDYESIKKIAAKYLDVDCIEQYIKNNPD